MSSRTRDSGCGICFQRQRHSCIEARSTRVASQQQCVAFGDPRIIILRVAGADSRLLKILLVIILRAVKLRRRHNLRYDRLLEHVILLEHGLRRARFLLLLLIVIKNSRAILRAHVRPLPVHRRRVMTLPEHRQQLQIRNLRRIKLHFHRLRMPGPPRANLFVVRMFRRPARVTHSSRSHPRHLPERILHSPKTTRRKSPLSHNLKTPLPPIYNELLFPILNPHVPTSRQFARGASVTASPRASADSSPQVPTRTTPQSPPPKSDASESHRAAPCKAALQSSQSAPRPSSPPRPSRKPQIQECARRRFPPTPS